MKVITKQFGDKQYNFGVVLVWSIVVLLTSISVYGFILESSLDSHVYVNCPNSSYGKCFNELYNSPSCGNTIPSDSPICSTEFLYPGQSFGQKPPAFLENVNLIILTIMVVGGILNHLLYNKDFKGEING